MKDFQGAFLQAVLVLLALIFTIGISCIVKSETTDVLSQEGSGSSCASVTVMEAVSSVYETFYGEYLPQNDEIGVSEG